VLAGCCCNTVAWNVSAVLLVMASNECPRRGRGKLLLLLKEHEEKKIKMAAIANEIHEAMGKTSRGTQTDEGEIKKERPVAVVCGQANSHLAGTGAR